MNTEEQVYIEKYDVYISKSFEIQIADCWRSDFRKNNPEWYEKVYLPSELWQKISASVKTGKECKGCSNQATAAHHRRYNSSTMSGYYVGHIDPICNKCHDEIHFIDGRRVKRRNIIELRWNKKIQEKLADRASDARIHKLHEG